MESKYPKNNFAIFSKQIDESLGEFFFKRLSARLIIANYLNVKEHGVSIIEDNIQVDAIIRKAYEEAKYLCVKKYGVSPGLKTEGTYPNFKYIPSHFFSIIFELLKNSMEATILNHEKAVHLPEVSVQMNDVENNLVIRIHDDGAGVPPQDLAFIWSHFYSTSSDSVHNSIEDPTRMLDSAVLSGFGFGLPITKMLIQYFGGDIALNSVCGSSTDVHLYFQGNDDAKYNTINPNHSY
jgi:pyruvate dehydrogenase kinase 2/3/4